MSQIINVHIGGCGVQVGLKFWESMQRRKQINQKDNLNAYQDRFYYETPKQAINPRAIFLDTDIRSNFLISQSNISFDTSLIYGYGSSCRNLYAEGKYGQWQQAKDMIYDILRRQAQKCDLLSGFLLTRSPTGGAGSGLGQNIINMIRQNNHRTMIEQFKIMPGSDDKQKHQNLCPLEIYNTILCNWTSIENVDLIYLFQNTKIQRILQQKKSKAFGLNQINQYIGICINQHVKAYVEPGVLSTNQRKRAVNLIPYPRIKSLCGSLSQFEEKNHLLSALNFQNRLIKNSDNFDERLYMLNIDICDNTLSERMVAETVKNWTQHSRNQFVDWIGNNIHLSFSKLTKNSEKSSWIIYNGTKNIEWAQKINQIYSGLARKKKYFHHYINLGMDQMEFVQAESAFNDFLSQYEQRQALKKRNIFQSNFKSQRNRFKTKNKIVCLFL